ncbi:MAG: histidine phosphatase family protein [Candidatus Krumholzibacteria bacterium]
MYPRAAGSRGNNTQDRTHITRMMVFALTIALLGSISGHAVAETADGIRTIYLIRHGWYDHRDKSDPDVGKALLPLGVAQAKLLAARLRSMPVEWTALHSSTMTRARQTARVVGEEFPELELQQTRLIRECTPPTWRRDIMEREEESELKACADQLDRAFAQFFVPSPGKDRHDILVCHGNVIRYFVTKVLGVDTMSWLRMSVGNCSMTIVRVNQDGSFKLLAVGDVGHLPANLQSGVDRTEKNLAIPGE